MEATSMTHHLLKGFCDGTQWKYAVFWKLNHRFPMTLTWEDGYYGYQKTNEAAESMLDDINFKFPAEVYSSSGEIIEDPGDYSAGLLMAEMSHHKYSLGEGVVGKVAFTGNHCWVSEDILTHGLDANLMPECPDEWLLQFASGIKTIVLIPVLPQGVLQFGSFQAVAEDLEFVTNIKEKFHSIHLLAASTTALNYGVDCQDWSISDPTNTFMDILDESSNITNSTIKTDVLARIAPSVNASTRLNPAMLSQVETKDNLEEEIWPTSPWVNDVGVFQEISNGLGLYSGKTEQQFGSNETGYEDIKDLNGFLAFPSESELHKVLGSAAPHGKTRNSMSKHTSVVGTYSNSTFISNNKEHGDIESLENPEDVDPKYLLDAVYGDLFSACNDTSSISNSFRSPVSKKMPFTGLIHPRNSCEESSLVMKDVKSDLKAAVRVMGRDAITSPSFDGNSSLLTDEPQEEKVYSHLQSTNGPKISSTYKKRARPGTQKSRPRDRQLIMDRMKELRELVPDGGKCSIDNLLERTIKHMLYLRKITSQAEKLKRFAHREVPKCSKQKINYNQSGRSCAYDLESEQAWPIVIEDLECSGHMLIEMVCNEHGFFLEIAQVIRKLELTILKGVLENRSSAAWACFIVEAPRGFHRMDVLCPLLHLLQRRKNPVSYKS
ncbi:transcription factor EMB1444-like [Arachis stenosperma]|uniref:transcription factor EMB1444-like n=1 Tax=Arachis stenosperma TaxID=217475 RepID=UPI0025AD4561|nr:transcription factor EMB1444-like [Arachis stenosperma]